jgi:hypothetical protein
MWVQFANATSERTKNTLYSIDGKHLKLAGRVITITDGLHSERVVFEDKDFAQIALTNIKNDLGQDMKFSKV